MEGEWTLEQGDLGGFLKMLAANSPEAREDAGEVMIRAFRNNSPQKLNGVKRSRINARHHYDIGNDLYASFLDSDMNYSCAFFGHAHMNLEQAQANKLSTTLKRLDVKPEMKVLDIGCGWGSLCRYASKNSRALSVTGITLAEDQAAYARKLVDPEYRNKLIYKIEDYREHARNHIGEYDRIVSTGMFEHVGEKNFRTYFAAIRKLLAGNGLALIHSILRPTSGRPTSIWMDRYIFPGGCIPWLPDMLEAAKAEGLEPVTKPYIHDSFHYAQTLRHWRENFNQAWPHLDQTRYDKRFFRMWNFYLAASEASFDGLGLHVGQILFRKA
jgi:cyclopropane-fatty-acyl-phospholipid synthase